MSRPLPVFVCCLGLLTVLAAGCGEQVDVPKTDLAVHHGAVLFKQRCSGCHTLDAAAARGSRPAGEVKATERTDGPNFNVRREARADVLYAIRNGGFSGAIMPENILVGEDAKAVASFLAQYSGRKAQNAPSVSVSEGPGER